MKNLKNIEFQTRGVLVFILFIFLLPLKSIGQSSSLNINIFPPDEIIDFEEPGVNGFDIDYQLFGSQSGAGAASATIEYYYCSDPSGLGCYFIDSRPVTLNCNSGLCIPQGGQPPHFIARTQLPSGFEDRCYSGDHYIVAVLTRNTGTQVLNTNPTDPVIFAHSKPDFTPIDVTVAPNSDVPGQAIITCTIINNGVCPGSTQATVWLTPDAGSPILFNVPSGNIGEPVTVSVTIDGLDVETFYDATLTVDVYNDSMESDETNNVLTLDDIYIIPVAMEIESFVPSSALVNSVVTITGTPGITAQGDFLDVYRAFLGGTQIEIVSVSANTMQVRIPYYQNSDFITLQTIYGTTVVSPNEFTILCSPSLADIEDGAIPIPWGTFGNPEDIQTFQVYNGGGSNGSGKSLAMDHYNYTDLGALDYLFLPHICVDNSPNWYFQFDLAYTYYSDGVTERYDNLYIQDLSTGDILAAVAGQDLATATPTSNFFLPSSGDWISYELSLTDLINAGQRELYIALITENGNGNTMLFDNIRVTQFSIFPVEYASLEALVIDKAVEVKWSTASESSNDYFIVQKSFDGEVFERIGSVQGSGTTSTVQKYSFIDSSPFPGINYYRLIQVDFDGEKNKSDIVYAIINTQEGEVVIYPNPGNGLINIATNFSKNITVTILDCTGKSIQDIAEFSSNANFDLSYLSDGIYFIQVTNGKTSYITKYLKKS